MGKKIAGLKFTDMFGNELDFSTDDDKHSDESESSNSSEDELDSSSGSCDVFGNNLNIAFPQENNDSNDESDSSVVFESSQEKKVVNTESEEDSEDETLLKKQLNVCEDIYSYCFVTEESRQQVSLESVKQIEQLLKTIVSESIKKSDQEIQKLNEAIQSLLKGTTGITRALLALALRQCISLLVNEEKDFPDNLKAYTSFIEKLLLELKALPSYEFYHQTDHYGVVEIVDPKTKEIVAYYKAGHHQQQSSQFLYELYQNLAKIMGFPKDLECAFPPCQPFDSLMSNIKFRKELALTEEDVISFMVHHQGKYYFSDVSLDKNFTSKVWLSGGIMPRISDLAPWEERSKKGNASLYMLIKLCFILMLGGRDVKSDGLGGNVSEVFFDMEDFLNKKPKKTNLHIPYMIDINNAEISKTDLEEMLGFMGKVNIGDIIEGFIKKWKYDDFYNRNEFSHRDDLQDFGGCKVEISEDDRSEYMDKRPKFIDKCILSQVQIQNFKDYFLSLKNALNIMVKEYEIRILKKENTVFHLIELFDPEWGQVELVLRKEFSEIASQSRSPSPNSQKQEIGEGKSQLTRSYDSFLQQGRNPSDLNGFGNSPVIRPLTPDERYLYARRPTPTPSTSQAPSLSSSVNDPFSNSTQALLTGSFLVARASKELGKLAPNSDPEATHGSELPSLIKE